MNEILEGYSLFAGTDLPNLKLADSHIHTTGSDGLPTPEQAMRQALKMGLSAVVFVDHDTIEAAQRAQCFAQEKGLSLEVVVGSEISTKDGHVIGLNLTENIISGMSAKKTILEILRQRGLVVFPHPMYWLTRSLGQKTLEQLINDPEIVIHGFEIYSGAVAHGPTPEYNQKARKFFAQNQQLLGTQLGGSDAHHLSSIGEAVTGYTGDSFCKAVEVGQTSVLFANELSAISFPDFIRQTRRGLITTTGRRIERYLKRSFPLLFPQ